MPDDLFFPDEFQGTPEPEAVNDLKHWEREITRLLVSYGDQTIQLDHLDFHL